MSRKTKIGKEYALVLAKYVARFHQVPPSILTERGATDLMRQRLERAVAYAPGRRVRESPPEGKIRPG